MCVCVCVRACVRLSGEVQAFHEDLHGRQYINEVYKFSVDKLYHILFTESQFMSDFMEQRRFSGQNLILSVLSEFMLKVTYNTTRCECDEPLQAVLKIGLFSHDKWACMTNRCADVRRGRFPNGF